jgi:hypothetical protein
MRDIRAVADDLGNQTRAPPGSAGIESEDWTCLDFVTFQTVIQRTERRGSIIWIVDMSYASCDACCPIVDPVVVPYLGTLTGQSQVHVALQPQLRAHDPQGGTMLPRVGEVLI